MKTDHRDTLLLAFEKDLIARPQSGERWLVLNGKALPDDPFGEAGAVFEQGYRPEYLALQSKGFSVEPHIGQGRGFDHAIVLAGRVRSVNEANFQRALEFTDSGASIIVAGDKTAGIGSLRKWASAITPVIGSYSKYHAAVFWCKNNGKSAANRETLVGPLFSADSPDKGSQLLARFFDKRIKGKVADFGAGTGYLTSQLIEKCLATESVDLLEAEWSALEQARISLTDAPKPLNFNWIDITSELKKKPYEWIVMNPPFHHGLHDGRQADPELGKRFIQLAASTLVQGGRLLMVANRNLPYEDTLNAAFRKVVKLADEAGYKVFEAVR